MSGLNFSPTHKQPAILTCLGTGACRVDRASVCVCLSVSVNLLSCLCAGCLCVDVAVTFFFLIPDIISLDLTDYSKLVIVC